MNGEKMFAIISHKTKQYKVEAGKTYRFDLIEDIAEKKIKFDEVLLVGDEKSVKIGEPLVKGASVEAEILGDVKADKVTVLKFHAKKHYKRVNGHRQNYTEIKISSINA
ncbi:MAG TPA: 50S ribosomal protein L21 [Patescibacteria group bacterium]|nr:50S ribosomal protein L21 [Patescibacteria group bacterium]